jgi:hypothetical protein
MPFKPGNKLSKGRPVGAINRSTEQAKLSIARIANYGLENFKEDLDKIREKDPIEAAKLSIRLLEFIVPKKSSTEIKAQIDQRIQQITVNITDGITDKHNEDISQSS